jgi:2-amino-4-hydroxy-6-hydroxymethyldihydropteridine diphosphokinase/dihydropteroate synthase
LMVGHSRKSFLTSITKLPSAERDLETTTISPHLVENGTDYLRVHHAEFLQRSLAVWTQLNGIVRYQK